VPWRGAIAMPMLASVASWWPLQSNGARSASVDPRHQRRDVGRAFDAVLHDGEFVAAEAGDEVARPAAGAGSATALQQFVADQMSRANR
jgi:hypothetical protein